MEHKQSKTTLDFVSEMQIRSFIMQMEKLFGVLSMGYSNATLRFTSPRIQLDAWGSAASPILVIRHLLRGLDCVDRHVLTAFHHLEDCDIKWGGEAWLNADPRLHCVVQTSVECPHSCGSLDPAFTAIMHSGDLQQWFSAFVSICGVLQRKPFAASNRSFEYEATELTLRRAHSYLASIADLTKIADYTFYDVQGWRSYKCSRQSDTGAIFYRYVHEVLSGIFNQKLLSIQQYEPCFLDAPAMLLSDRRDLHYVLQILSTLLLAQVAGSVYVADGSESDLRFSDFLEVLKANIVLNWTVKAE